MDSSLNEGFSDSGKPRLLARKELRLAAGYAFASVLLWQAGALVQLAAEDVKGKSDAVGSGRDSRVAAEKQAMSALVDRRMELMKRDARLGACLNAVRPGVGGGSGLGGAQVGGLRGQGPSAEACSRFLKGLGGPEH